MGLLGMLVRRLCRDDSGAVTIDWVTLTSAVLLLGFLVIYPVFNIGVSNVKDDVNDILVSASDFEIGVGPAINIAE